MMASNTDIEEIVKCGICNSSFAESHPRILPCLHTFCTNCINTPSQTSFKFSCPYCKVKYSKAVTEKLPLNFSAACLGQILSEKPPACQNCLHPDHLSVALCCDCPCFLCSECMKTHVHVGQRNEVMLLSDIKHLKSCPPILPIFTSCKNHSKPMVYYCNKDEMSICEDCINDTHRNHLYSPIMPAIEIKKKHFENAINSCNSEITDLRQAVNTIKKTRTHMHERKEENIQSLNNFFNDIENEILDKRRKEIKQSIEDDHTSRDDMLQNQEDSLDSLLTQFNSINTFAQNMLQCTSPQDVIEFEHQITMQCKKLKEDKSKAIHTPQAEEQKLVKFEKEEKTMEPFFQIASGIDIKKCKINGPEHTRIVVGEKIAFHVILYPLYDHYMLDLKSLTVQVQYFNSGDDEVTTERVEIKRDIKSDHSEVDRLEITYIATKSGNHMVSVLVEGQHIPRSPFQMTAWLRNYTDIKAEKCQLIKGKHFRAPIGVAVGPTDKMMVLDCTNPKIIVFKQDFTKENIIELKKESIIELNEVNEIRRPGGIAVHNDMIAVSDHSNSCVKLFSIQGESRSSIGTPSQGNKPGQFNHPYGLAFNSKGILYVSDSNNYRVQAFDTNHNNQFCVEFGSKGPGPGQFKGITGYIAIDKIDHIYVTDYYGDAINIYSAGESHDFLCKIDCKRAWAIAITPDDCLVVSSNKAGTDTLRIYSPSSQIGYSRQLVAKFGGRGSDKGKFWRIYGIAVGKNGAIYVAEFGTNRIQIINT